MMDDFVFNARQYYDFRHANDDDLNDSYFDINEERVPSNQQKPNLCEDVDEIERFNISDTESDHFFTPVETKKTPGVSSSIIYLKGRLRKSLSMSNLPTDPKDEELSDGMNHLNINGCQQPPRPASACSQNLAKAPSQDHINRLAQPKRCVSNQNLNNRDSMTLAQAVAKFQTGTPKRFRSKPSPKLNKFVQHPVNTTKPHSPKLLTNKRIRPVVALSKEEQEQKEMEEAMKFKIKAKPVNKRVLQGPLKPQIEKKPVTSVEPFHLTETKKKNIVEPEVKAPVFKAQPVPKSLHNPYKIKAVPQEAVKSQTPHFSKRLTKSTSNCVENPKVEQPAVKTYKLQRTQPHPFSFEKRDQEMLKKKEEFIQKVLEEEKKAREFHARPPPKAILRSRNSSQDLISEPDSTKSTKSDELNTHFKARPATVLKMKPFVPKKDEAHIVKIQEFYLSTDQRIEARHKFEEKIKEKQANIEAQKREAEEKLKKEQEEEVAKLRKQADFKAQPVKKFKEFQIQHTFKVTEPISPKFHTERIRNKENIF